MLHEDRAVDRNARERRLPGHFARSRAADYGAGHRSSHLSSGSDDAIPDRDQGYAEVLPDRVIVLAELSERAEEINVDRTRAAEGNARADIAKAGAGDKQWCDASFKLERALVRQQAAAKVGAAVSDASH